MSSYLDHVSPRQSFTHGSIVVADFGRFISLVVGTQRPVTLSHAQIADVIRALRDVTVSESE